MISNVSQGLIASQKLLSAVHRLSLFILIIALQTSTIILTVRQKK